MIRLIIIGVLLNLCSWLSLAQGENNYWYLGIPLGVDFNQPTPKFTNMHALGLRGGGASVCDAQGNLLFYTNGGGIFKADHSLMPGTANFTNNQTGAILPFEPIANNDSFSVFYNYFNTDIKIVQLDATKPRYHIFYMIFENGSNWNIGLVNIPLHKLDQRMPSLAYSIVDMSLNNGQGGIDPNFHNVIVDRQLMRHFDVMTDGQCGVWIVVNKRYTSVWPTTAQEDQGQLLSYLLQPNGTIILANSQTADYYQLPSYLFNSGNDYPHIPIRISQDGKYLLLMYGGDNQSFPFFYGNYFLKTIVRSFDSKTGKSEIVDTIFPNNMDPAGNLMLPEHDVYITDSAAWVYSFFLSDTIYAYPGQYLGNFTAMQQNKLTINLDSLTRLKMHIAPQDTFQARMYNTKMRVGPDGKLYFLYIMQAWGGTQVTLDEHNRSLLILGCIPNPSLPISANNFEIVDTYNIKRYFNELEAKVNLYPNEIGIRSTKLQFDIKLLSHDSRIHQIGSNAVIFRPKDDAPAVLDTVLCAHQGFTVYAPYPQYNNLWTPGNSSSDSLYIQAPGTYTLTTTAPHCTFTQQYQVAAAEEEFLQIIQQDTLICAQLPITLQGQIKGPITNIMWNTGATSLDLPDIIAAGNYYLTGTGLCGTYSDSVQIMVEDCSCKPFVANGFTPNGDGLNDRLYTYLSCEYFHYQFRVYNRWGACVFSSQQANDYWDGTINGKAADVGVYFYYMEFLNKLNKKQTFKGEVHLIR